MNQELFKKLQAAREIIKSIPVKKAGWNNYSEYHYFTPEQINAMVHHAEKETGLIHLFNLIRDGNGYHGHLDILDLETGEKITFTQATEIPIIKATNVAQQIGGAVTYTNRYMLMTAYDIADNSLDLDSIDQKEKPEAKQEEKPKPKKLPVIPEKRFAALIASVKAEPEDAAYNISETRKVYIFTNEQEVILAEWEATL